MAEDRITPSTSRPVKRYSAVPLFAGITVAGVIVAILVMTLGGNKREKESASEKKAESEIARLKQVNQRTKQGYWFDNKSIPVAPNPVPVETAASSDPFTDPSSLPPAQQTPTELERKIQEEYEKADLEMVRYQARQPLTLMEKRQDGIQAALHVIKPREAKKGKPGSEAKAENGVDQSGPRIVGFNNHSSNGLAAYQGMLQQNDFDQQNRQGGKSEFLETNAKAVADNYLLDTLHEPLSPYEVKAGTVIPAALITGINSDLPGSIIAQVREHVYDTVSGNHLLIPQGSRLIGQYDSQISFGQNRALVVWNRLIMPDGKSIDLGRMQGVDIAGYAGFKDQVDNHYMRIYGNALLMSLVGAGYDLMANPSGNPYDDNDSQDTIAANVGLQLAQVTEQLTRKNINIQPTIVIRQGYRFNVMVLKDMILRPR